MAESFDIRIHRGRRAEEILSDPIIRGAFDDIERAITEKWKASPLSDIEGQHELRLMLKIFSDFKKHFEYHIRTGKLAEQEKSHAQKMAKRIGAFVKGIRR